MSSKLLLDSQPLVILPELAVSIGLNEAIVLQQVHYWCEINAKAKRNYKDGHYWVYNSFKEWKKQFPWWCERTIKSIFSKLENQNLIISANYNRVQIDRTKWYRVNHDALDAIADFQSGSCKICTMDNEDIAQAIPEINTEKNNNGVIAPQAANNACLISPDSKSDGIDIQAFIEWYYTEYFRIFGKPHPRLRRKQTERVIDELESFLSDHTEVDMEALQDMANDFFYNVDSNDWHITHFATPGILQNRYWDVYRQ